MRRTLSTLVIGLMLVLSSDFGIVAKSNPLNSIRPLQTYITDEDSQETTLDTFCTVWNTVYHEKRMWVSAFHCVFLTEDNSAINEKIDYYIDGKQAYFVGGDANADLSIFSGGPSADPLPIAVGMPGPLTPIWSAGFPFGVQRLRVTEGVLSAIRGDEGRAIWQVPVAGGMSGAPVLTKQNMVIGTMQRSECPRFTQWCPVSEGATLDVLRAFLDLTIR